MSRNEPGYWTLLSTIKSYSDEKTQIIRNRAPVGVGTGKGNVCQGEWRQARILRYDINGRSIIKVRPGCLLRVTDCGNEALGAEVTKREYKMLPMHTLLA